MPPVQRIAGGGTSHIDVTGVSLRHSVEDGALGGYMPPDAINSYLIEGVSGKAHSFERIRTIWSA